jgi:hypothetical protein
MTAEEHHQSLSSIAMNFRSGPKPVTPVDFLPPTLLVSKTWMAGTSPPKGCVDG